MNVLRSRQKEGFTLAEVTIAATLMAIAVSGSLGLMAWVNQATAFNLRYSQAAALNQDKMEELMADMQNAASGSDTYSFYSRSWTVTDMGSSSAKKLEVGVTWPNPFSRDNHTTSLESIIAPDEVTTSNQGLKQPYAAPPVIP